MLIKAISLVIFFEALLIQVNGVPLRVLGPQDGSSEEISRVKEATTDANGLVTKMEEVHGKAVNGDAASLSKVHQAFGDHADLNGVGANIQKLKDGKFRMEQAKDSNYAGQGYYDPGKNVVGVGSGFHQGTSADARATRAGTIIHEASHSILGTKDIFDKNGSPTSRGKPTEAGDKVGYKDSHLPEMLHDPKYSKNLHQNADSWRVFGDLCRRQLERRAFEEPDLMKRDEILQARATSCALPPRKPTTPAKATGHDEGGKLTTHLGAKTPANGRKAIGEKSLFKGGKQTSSRGVAKTRAKTTAMGGKVNGGAKTKVAAASKKAAIRTASKKSPSTARGGKVRLNGGAKTKVAAASKKAATRTASKKSPSTARGGRVRLNGGAKTKVAAASKKAATRTASKKSPSTARGGKVNGGTKPKVAAFKKVAAGTASKKSSSLPKLARTAVKVGKK